MNSDERADWLARAIDEIIRHGEPPAAPEGLDQAELASLLEAARLRLEAGRSAREASTDHESAVWARLVERLDASQTAETRSKASRRVKGPPPHDESSELREVIALRMQIAREALDMADEHRDEVWQRIRSRLGAEAGRPIPHDIAAEPPPVPPPNVPERRRRAADRQPQVHETPAEQSGWRWPGLHYAAAVVIVAVVAAAAAAFQLT